MTDPMLHAILDRQATEAYERHRELSARTSKMFDRWQKLTGERDQEAARLALATPHDDNPPIWWTRDAWGVAHAQCDSPGCRWRVTGTRIGVADLDHAVDLHEAAHRFGQRIEVAGKGASILRKGQVGTVLGIGPGVREPAYNGDELVVLFDGEDRATTIATRHTKAVDQ